MEPVIATQTLFFEDLCVGDRWISPSRKITAADVSGFADLTGDHDPLHEDTCGGPFGEPIAHGLLGLSILAGLSTEHPRVSTLALTGIQDWSFEAPIFFGDQVRVVTTVVQTQRHGRRAGRVTWRRELINQDGRVVQRGDFVSLVAVKDRQVRPRSTGDTSALTLGGQSIDDAPGRLDADHQSSQRGTLPAR